MTQDEWLNGILIETNVASQTAYDGSTLNHTFAIHGND